VGVSRARIDQKKDESIWWKCTLFLYNDAANIDHQSPFPDHCYFDDNLQVYRNIHAAIPLYYYRNYRNFMFYPRCATKKLFWNVVSALLFFSIASYFPLYIIYPSIRNRVFPSDKQDIYRNNWLFLDMID